MAPIFWVFSGIVVFFAAIITSVTGFGFQLLATPLFLLFLDVRTAIVYVALLSAATCIPVVWNSRQFVKPRQIALLGIGCVAGLPAGILVQSHISPFLLKIAIAILAVVFAVLMALGYSFRTRRENLGYLVAGFIGGTFMTGAGLGGPPVVLFLLNQTESKQHFRANVAAFLTISGVTSLIALKASDLVDTQVLLEALVFVPLIALGYLIGIKILPRIRTDLFRNVALAIVILAGISAVISTLLSLR